MGKKTKRGDPTYLESRKTLLDAYNVAAATNPAACRPRVIDETRAAPGRPSSTVQHGAVRRKI
ncbi:hypothetical protein EC912_101663 [Luteibacter rhizovicinus]|uniref:Uncharacterized protein n=1 Tax=Luteibacter rhizovicinus TaxID=242606 RepID=A0A4R3YYF9_9GAMM|nr:hypothetical protein [Luteibacter rhizovicinus]TCV97646.1 hypothetical protein EC912_101663 [Luteibacter rhizovicinus]